jgi:predicted GNAT family acetyltransferase
MLTIPVRHLAEADRAGVERLLDAHPIASAQVTERIEMRGLGWRADGRLYGYGGARRAPESLLWCGGQVTPLGADAAAVAAFAELAGGQPRMCASLVGPADAVLDLWGRLRPHWGPERTVRVQQPLLLLENPPSVSADPLVRHVRPDEVDMLFPAAVAMYTEEVGVSPVSDDGGRGYRGRIGEMVRAGRSYARIVDGSVVFKAELAVITRHTAQLQGVWVDPSWRGRGVATAALATVVRDALRRVAPTISLYVNDYNAPARRVYERLGFRQVGTFATVLF